MPQFDPAVWSPQIVWLAISFIALYLLMSRIALPRISDILEEREHKISDSLRKAEHLKEDAEAAVAEYERTMADARTRAQSTVREIRDMAAAEAAARHGELSGRLHAEVAAAEGRIAAARDAAVAGIRDVAIDVAAVAVERLLAGKADRTAVAAAVDAVLEGQGR